MNTNENAIWDSVVDNLSIILDEDALNFLHTLELRQQNQQWSLLAPNKYALEQAKKKYLSSIELALKKFKIDNITLKLDEGDLFTPAKKEKTNHQPFKSNLNTDYQFHNFVLGPSNDQAYMAAKSVADGNLAFNPLLIYGGTGLGKSHLMHAVGNALRANGTNRVMYLTAEQFVNDLISTLYKKDKNKTMSDFANLYRNVDALLIDDVQFLGGNKSTSQTEFFHTFNALFDNNRHIILTCDRYPKEIENLEDRLKSRFGSGLTVSIEPPELETRVAIVKSKADQLSSKQLNFVLPDDVAFFIASKVASNVRDLEGALLKVFALCNYKHIGTASIELAKEALTDLINAQKKQVSIDNIQRTVAKYYQLSIDDLTSKSRKAAIVHPRQIAMSLSKNLTKLSLAEIGQAFGGRDHSTVLHACDKIDNLLESNSDFKQEYNGLRMSITG